MTPNYAKKVKEEIDNLLKGGYIAEVESSDWLFPIVVVPKKNSGCSKEKWDAQSLCGL